ncbi:MAG: fibronectin type III domain-containing protein [Saprospiraceae bacterium]|nr:fibronectin type III domain-containing protein [Saprospiraceae bacterium]
MRRLVLGLGLQAIMMVTLSAQVLQIQPYLQEITPHSAAIMWQTDWGDESIVEYGPTPALGQESTGNSLDINFDNVRLHMVRLTDLQRFTKYYYRIRTGAVRSDVFTFKTAPFPSDHTPFRMVAMSDMQYDRNRPWQFSEIVNEGVVKFFHDAYGPSLSDELALLLVPGDLVTTGTTFQQWQNHFFNPGQALFSRVPVYPVPGNHERNSDFFFQYFMLPRNGTAAYAEHWWYKDYGNVRVLGLDSNEGYRNLSHQINWLDSALSSAASNPNIDFVFAQMHHPHKSELWIPGETDFSGEVVKRLESFTEVSGKPSIHFFGHTHGYSRGQSRDHQHLWVNVASAGGAIDNWGEFEGRDYEEFSVTQDEYGFVLVEIDPNPQDPKFSLKRISRGDQDVSRSNEITDSITVWKHKSPPAAPTALSPNGSDINLRSIVLTASPFIGKRASAFHAASQWQLSLNEDFEKPLVDSWKQHENWYYEENRQAADDLTDEKIYRLLQPNTLYYWRVRYRDQFLNWSNWSEVQSFKTARQ